MFYKIIPKCSIDGVDIECPPILKQDLFPTLSDALETALEITKTVPNVTTVELYHRNILIGIYTITQIENYVSSRSLVDSTDRILNFLRKRELL